MSARKRYAIVGTGGRCVMFIDAIARDYRDHVELVAFCDPSPTRMAWHNRRIDERHGHPPVPCYATDAFDTMIRETRPDVVIVTTVDAAHHAYIIRAMDLGCDVISEKPLTTDAPKAAAIFEAIERTGRSLRVAFNYRYAPHVTKVKELLMQGVVGRPTAVDFSWVLDTRHGADYFRRWHATKANSGGLLVHKSTHHFDLVNWWLDDRPRTVFAMGDLRFYGRANAEARGERYSYDRYTGSPDAADDPFALFLDPPPGGAGDHDTSLLRGLYRDAEADSGYIRDRNVFGDHVDIEDTMAVMVRYRRSAVLNYSLVAYSPWEGFRVSITGDRGRLELFDQHGSHIIAGQSDEELARVQAKGRQQRLQVFPMFGAPYDVEIPKAEGGHGGGDPVLLEQLFSPMPPEDPYRRAASHIDGAASMLIGASANESMETGLPIQCDDLLPLPAAEVGDLVSANR